MATTRNLSTLIIIGFLVGLLASLCAARSVKISLQKKRESIQVITKHGTAVNEKLFQSDVHSAADAKKNHLFWAYTPDDILPKRLGAALKLTENPEIFNDVFPGYRWALYDEALWEKYFNRSFDGFTFSPLLLNESKNYVGVSTSSPGCTDIFRRHSADVLILGSSETYHGLIPSQIQKGLGFDAKVLQCAGSGALIETMAALLENFELSKNHANVVVIGFSFWNAYLRSKSYKETLFNPLTEIMRVRNDLKTNYLHSTLAELFPPLSWSDLVPLVSSDFKFAESAPHEKAEALNQKDTLNLEMVRGSKAAFYDRSGRVFIRSSILSNESEIIEALAKLGGEDPFLRGSNETDCDMREVDRRVDDLLRIARKTAKTILVYIPPTTPLHVRSAPPCFLTQVKALLKSKESASVKVITDSMDEYGLKYSDFAFSHENGRYSIINVNHLNYTGAQKVTRRIAHELSVFFKGQGLAAQTR